MAKNELKNEKTSNDNDYDFRKKLGSGVSRRGDRQA